jgi:hypothetical protein
MIQGRAMIQGLGILLILAVLGNWLFYFEGERGYTLGTSIVVTLILLPLGLGLIAWSQRRSRRYSGWD